MRYLLLIFLVGCAAPNYECHLHAMPKTGSCEDVMDKEITTKTGIISIGNGCDEMVETYYICKPMKKNK